MTWALHGQQWYSKLSLRSVRLKSSNGSHHIIKSKNPLPLKAITLSHAIIQSNFSLYSKYLKYNRFGIVFYSFSKWGACSTCLHREFVDFLSNPNQYMTICILRTPDVVIRRFVNIHTLNSFTPTMCNLNRESDESNFFSIDALGTLNFYQSFLHCAQFISTRTRCRNVHSGTMLTCFVVFIFNKNHFITHDSVFCRFPNTFLWGGFLSIYCKFTPIDYQTFGSLQYFSVQDFFVFEFERTLNSALRMENMLNKYSGNSFFVLRFMHLIQTGREERTKSSFYLGDVCQF